ncbi:hypothetical protein LBMAG57_32030 [Verrucomicrobiota bacterium]|nr:hypothetical protein LBMAG57_32030 [Verrucomicrobiota bacterium]
MKRCIPLFTLLAVVAAMQENASACAVCMGDPNSALAIASDATLWTLLSLVGFIFIATGATMIYLWRRGNRQIPADVQFVENLTAEPEEC